MHLSRTEHIPWSLHPSTAGHADPRRRLHQRRVLLDIGFVRSVDTGPVIEGIALQLKASSAQVGTSDFLRLKIADIFRAIGSRMCRHGLEPISISAVRVPMAFSGRRGPSSVRPWSMRSSTTCLRAFGRCSVTTNAPASETVSRAEPSLFLRSHMQRIIPAFAVKFPV